MTTTNNNDTVRAAYFALTAGKLNETVTVLAIRQRCPDLGWYDVDDALVELFLAGECVLFPDDNTRRLTAEVEDAGVDMGGDALKHLVKFDGGLP